MTIAAAYPFESQGGRGGGVVGGFDGGSGIALGDRFWLFIQTLNNDKKPFNSIFNSKTKSNYSFKEFIHSKTKSNYSFKELFIQNGQNNPAWENS